VQRPPRAAREEAGLAQPAEAPPAEVPALQPEQGPAPQLREPEQGPASQREELRAQVRPGPAAREPRSQRAGPVGPHWQ